MSDTVNDSTLASPTGKSEGITELRRQETLLKTGALQNAILNSANFSSIATDEKGVIQIFNVGAERMLGYAAADVLNKITPADISDPQEVIARAKVLSVELGTHIAPGFEALVFKASRGIEDIYELTYIRKDGSRFPAVVSVTALRDDQGAIIGYLLIGTDNTARKHAEEALLKAGALQNAIFNSTNFSSIATDAKGIIQLINVGAERMTGYTAADVLNKITPADIFDPQEVIARAMALSTEHETQVMPGFDALAFKAALGIEDIYELTCIRKDGSRFPAIVSFTALRGDQDAVIGYLLIATDNTARKQVEAERQQLLEVQVTTNSQLLQAYATLQVSEEKFAVTLHSIGDAVIATDAEGRVTLLNPLAQKLTGWTQTDAIGLPVEDVFHIISQETRQPTTIPVMATLAHGTTQGMANHTVLVARDGSECAIADSCAPIRDRDSQVVGAVLVFRDVTGEYAVQQALRDQQFYTRSLIESNIDALMTTDPAGIITDVNQQMVALTGCPRDELIGTPFKHYFTDPARAEAGIKQVLRDKNLSDYELTALHKFDGETVVSYNAATFYNADGELQGVFAAARDITERKRLDQVLQNKNVELERARFVAEKANLAKSDFLSSMSHELRTPLNAILGFAQLLEAGSPPPTAAQTVRLHQITKAGWYLLDLINEILDLAVIESGTLLISHESVSLIEVLHECEAMIEPQLQQRDIQISFPPFDPDWHVNADRVRVKQALINLLSNAIKYNREHGTVEVRCSLVSPERLRISVKDSGEGLPPHKLLQLFHPFNRLGQEHGPVEGTGIGLVVTKQLVELMGGMVGVESTVGVGSEFWMELNVDEKPQLAAGSIMPEPISGQVRARGGVHTLVYVEDNPANLMLVEQIIEDHPQLHMLSARDGNQGIALARTHLPDVILMDINLPGMSGFEALKVLHDDPTTAHIPVIALSADAMPHNIEKGLEAGFFNYLTKPIKVNEFTDALDKALAFSDAKLDGPVQPGLTND
ncbi:MAG: PAS domain S-box protein [Sulfuriferula multivorans]|uniref:histidine kinase n=1 Tax=Sulfuriferula multivorans TaxID=1559896 RepID=A0A7C9TBS6_9PROT|nr:PAS domain S-box protein [Sulfuriferula multivorans]